MAQIKLEPNELLSLAGVLGQQQRMFSEIAAAAGSVQSALDLEISSTAQIEQQLSRIQRDARRQEELLGGLSGGVRSTVDAFAACDKRLAGTAEQIGDPQPHTILQDLITGAWLPDWKELGWMLPELGGYSALAGIFGGAALGTALTDVADPNKHGALWEKTFGEGTTTTLSFMGYDTEENSVEGYLARLSGEDEVALFGDIKSTTKTEVKVGAVCAKGYNSAEFWSPERSDNAKEGFELKDGELTELDGSMRVKDEFTLLNVGAGVEVGATAGEFDYETSIGTDDIKGTVNGNLKVGDLDLGGKAGVKIDTDGISAALGAEAGATLAEVEGSAKFEAGGFEVGTTVSAEIGFGASAGFEFDDGKLDVELGAAFGIGGKVKFSVKVPDLGLPWW